MNTPAITAPAKVPNGLRLAMASSSEANVVICRVADSAISLAAVPACEIAACPRSTAPPTVFFAESMALRAVSPSVSGDCVAVWTNRTVPVSTAWKRCS